MLSLRPRGTPPRESISMQDSTINPKLAREAKAIVALAFRNGPIEKTHEKITDNEMKAIMKNAVDYTYTFLVLKETDPARYEKEIKYGSDMAREWDEPVMPAPFQPS